MWAIPRDKRNVLGFHVTDLYRTHRVGRVQASKLCVCIKICVILISFFKGTVPWDFRLFSFFTWIGSPQAPDYPLRPFQIFSKIAEIFAAQGAPPVSKTLVAKGKKSSIWKVFIISFGHLWVVELAYLPPVSLIPVVHLDLRISPQIFKTIRNDPSVIFRGLKEDDSWKKSEAKNLVTLSL